MNKYYNKYYNNNISQDNIFNFVHNKIWKAV